MPPPHGASYFEDGPNNETLLKARLDFCLYSSLVKCHFTIVVVVVVNAVVVVAIGNAVVGVVARCFLLLLVLVLSSS